MPVEQLSALLEDLAAAPRAGEAWQRPLGAGETVGRFELVREIGRGGFGVVYQARDRELGREVAFKAVRPGQAHGGAGGENLVREAEAIARLSHPNLVTLYDVGRCEHGPFLVLELLRGATLKERLAQGALPVPEALRVAVQVARGLAHAHAHGVVHRDLKPSNVFLCEGGLVKVLDFGMAHAFGRTRLAGGTPAYMAPEQWRDAPEDERTDVFALGVMLHEMLAGEPPFANGGKDLQDGQTPPTLRVPDAPALGPLVGRMLQEDPVARPRHAGEVLEALTALHDELQRSGTGAPTVRLERPRPRWLRLALAAGAAAALLAAALGGVAWWSARPAVVGEGGPPCVAVLPFTSLSSSPDDGYFAEGIHGELITQLAKIAGLRVIGRSSVQPYRAGTRDLRRISRELGAGALLEGTVQRAGPRVRIAAHLVDPRSGQELWSDRFDRKVDDVFQIQTEVALEIARLLGARLTATERDLVSRVPTRDREAHDLFLRGMYYWERSIGVEADNRMAHELFTKALERDPGFALAHAWIAIVETDLDDCASARVHAGRAVALQPDLPQAHMARGELAWACDHDTPASLRAYQEAVRGAPGDATTRVNLGWYKAQNGDLEGGLADLETALALDPRSYLVAIEVTLTATGIRRFDEAAHAAQRALEISPGDVHALLYSGLIPYWRDGDLARARTVLEELPREKPHGHFAVNATLQLLALFPERTLELAAQGRLTEPFSTDPYIPLDFVVARAHAELGHAAQARETFGRAIRELEAHPTSETAARWITPYRHLYLGRSLAGAGRPTEALREERLAWETEGEASRKVRLLADLADIALASGRPRDAVAYLRRLLEAPTGTHTFAALAADPRFAALRDDPGFVALRNVPVR